MVLRGCLENSIYGLYLSRHDEHAEIWLQRNNDQESKKKAKDIFKISTLLSFLATLDAESGRVAKALYDRTIDLGAHPNELALLSALRMQSTPARDDLLVAYISGDSLTNELSLKTAFEVGLCSLSIFRNVLKERYDIMGITEQLEALKRGGA